MWQRLHDRAYQAIKVRTEQPVRMRALFRFHLGLPREAVRQRIKNKDYYV